MYVQIVSMMMTGTPHGGAPETT